MKKSVILKTLLFSLLFVFIFTSLFTFTSFAIVNSTLPPTPPEEIGGNTTALFNETDKNINFSDSLTVHEQEELIVDPPQLTLSFQIKGTAEYESEVNYYTFNVYTPVSVTFTAQNANIEILSSEYVSVGGAGTYSLEKGDYFLKVCGNLQEEYTVTAIKEILDVMDLSEYNMVTSMLEPTAPHSYTTRTGVRTGGNTYSAVTYFSRGDGPVDESLSPYIMPYDKDGFADTLYGFSYESFSSPYELRQAVMLPKRQHPLDNDIYKAAIVQWGGVMAGVKENYYFYNDNETYYYHPSEIEGGSGHSVCIIGFDDTIAKENFTVTLGETTYTPQGDGAFIIKNSYGTNRGDNGILYVSYYSMDLSSNPATVFFLENNKEKTVYQYDYLGNTSYYNNDIKIQTNDIYQKNVFTAAKSAPLTSVSFYLTKDNLDYSIAVKTANKETVVKEGNMQFGGYYKESITPVYLNEGEVFEVIVRAKSADGSTFYVPLQTPEVPISANTKAQSGQCFLSYDGNSWEDISANNTINCVKAFQDEPISTEKTVKNNLNFENLPTKFDLRDLGIVTSIKHQGAIPSCWSFATCASCETMLLRGTKADLPYIKKVIPTSLGDINVSYAPDCFPSDATLNFDILNENSSEYFYVKNALKGIGNNFYAFDININHNGKQIQPNSEITFSFELPKNFGSSKLYGVNDFLREIDFTVNNNILEFSLSSLSLYALTSLNYVSLPTTIPTSTPIPSPTLMPSPSPDVTNEVSPNAAFVAAKTGDTNNLHIYILLLALAVSVLFFIWLKRSFKY